MSVRPTANRLFQLLGEPELPPLEPLTRVEGYAAQLSDAFLEQNARDIEALERVERQKQKGERK